MLCVRCQPSTLWFPFPFSSVLSDGKTNFMWLECCAETQSIVFPRTAGCFPAEKKQQQLVLLFFLSAALNVSE